MTERVVSVRLQAKVEGFTAGMRKAKSSVDDLTKADVPKSTKAFGELANKAALAGTAIGVGIGVAVKRFADFDQAMSAVKANSGATGRELDALRAQAIKLGADSQFSATEAAQGINELAKAGVKTGDILNGGLKGALDLAAAGQIEVGQAAETAASAMTQFGLSGDKTAHIADLLTNGANKAQGGVLDLGQALNQAGLVASATGLTIEETTAGLTAFAAAGLTGSDAGTSFKTMLQRLSAPSGEAADLMKKLGISAYDSQGNFVGLANVAGQLQGALGDLTPAQRNSALATIFGSDAVRAANVLYTEGADGISKWTDEVNQQGAAAKQAATLTDNLKGDIERFGGALDSAFIQTGSSANGALRTLVQGVTGLVDVIAKVPGPVLLAGAGLTSLALLAPKGIIAFRNYKAQLDTLGLSMDKLSTKAPRAAKALGGLNKIGTAVAIASVASSFSDEADHLSLGVDQLTAALLAGGDAAQSFSDQIARGADLSNISSNIDSLGKALDATFDPGLLQRADDLGGSLYAFTGGENLSDVQVAAQRFKELDGALSGLVSNGAGDRASVIFGQIAAQAQRQGYSVEQLNSVLPQYREALAGASNAQSTATGTADLLTQANEATAKAAEDAKKETDDYVQSLIDGGLATLDTRGAQREYRQAILDANAALKENGKGLNINTEAGFKNQEALDGLARNANNLAQSIYDETGSEEKFRASLSKSRTDLIKAAERFGLTKTQAEKYADSVLKIPAAKATTLTLKTVGLSDLKKAQDYLHNIRDKKVTLTVGTIKVGNAKVNAGQFADGGAIHGPGTGTSDSIPALLSNGEHVWTAAEVAKLGGQSAMYALRAAVRAGTLPGFAAGGAVPAYAPPVQYVRTSGSTSREGATYAPTFNAYGNDANEAMKAAMRRYDYDVASRM